MVWLQPTKPVEPARNNSFLDAPGGLGLARVLLHNPVTYIVVGPFKRKGSEKLFNSSSSSHRIRFLAARPSMERCYLDPLRGVVDVAAGHQKSIPHATLLLFTLFFHSINPHLTRDTRLLRSAILEGARTPPPDAITLHQSAIAADKQHKLAML